MFLSVHTTRFLNSTQEEITMKDINLELNKGIPFNLGNNVDYADGSVVSKILLKKNTGNITLFSPFFHLTRDRV